MATKRKIFAATFGLIALVIIAFLVVRPQDTDPFDDDLKPDGRILNASENSFDAITKAAEAVTVAETDLSNLAAHSAGKNWDPKFAARVLADNQKALALWQQAMATGVFQFPEFGGNNGDSKVLSEWRYLTMLASVQAGQWARDGKTTDALTLALQIVQFGHMVENSRGMMIHYLVGMGIKSQGLDCLRRIALETTIPPERLSPWIARLEPFAATGPGLTNTYKMEYRYAMQQFHDYSSGKLLATNSLFDRSAGSLTVKATLNLPKTKQLVADAMRRCLASIPLPLNQMPLSEISPPRTNISTVKLFMHGNYSGEILVAMLAPGLTNILTKKCQENATIRATQLVLALKCYSIEHRQYPETLADLVPKYFKTIPLDDFDGKPMRYSRDKKVVYSVGEDLVDSGGIASTNRHGPGDLIFEFETKSKPKVQQPR